MGSNIKDDNIGSYSILDIVNLVKKTPNIIPNVQRRFIWKPSQIENVWDSILRGYPIGAFVFNRKNMDLLDGQQRATSICMGFGDVINLDKRSQNFRLFIDLEKPKNTDKRMYIFRIITKSHPWGYQKTDNTKTLNTNNIRDALEEYGVENFLSALMDNFWPYDATFPVPVEFFLDSKNWQDCETKIDNWFGNHKKLNEKIMNKKNDNLYSLKELFEKFNDVKTKQLIPALYLDVDSITEMARNSNIEDDEAPDDVENLFIRLNSGGTALAGEELNYSILKSKIDKNVQEKIEESCIGIMKPSRLITIAYRLFQSQNKAENQADALSMRIRPKQFQSAITKNVKDFEKFLENNIINSIEEMSNLLCYAPNTCEYGLPSFVVANIAESAPEVTFIILYRLIFKEDYDKIFNNNKLHRHMIGVVLLLLWFGRGSNGRNHSKMLNQLWNKDKRLLTSSALEFWSCRIYNIFLKTKQKIDTECMIKVPTMKALNKYLSEREDIFDNLSKEKLNNSQYNDFLMKTYDNKDLLLYVQRKSLHIWFGASNNFVLEDTNVPFDIDHISPQKYVYRCWHINPTLSFWYYKIGNLRAWPYSSNRSDGDVTPKEKLSQYNDGCVAKLCKSVGLQIDDYITQKGILLEWSKCDKSWVELDSNTLSNDDNAKKTLRCIIRRMREIYRDLYENLLIEDLIKIQD